MVLIPKISTDLTARQYADHVLLTVSVPDQNTNGSELTALGGFEIHRSLDKDRSNAAEISEERFRNEAQLILTVPAERIQDYLRDSKIVYEDPLSMPDRGPIYREGFRYAVRFLNRKHQSAGFSNQAFISPTPIPPPPSGLVAEVTQSFIRLQWKAPSANMDGSIPPRIAGYNVYRSEDPKSAPGAPVNKELVQSAEIEDRNFEFDKTYYYAVSVVGSRELPFAESPASAPVAVVARDVFPPGAPQNLNVVAENGVAILLWAAPGDPDVAGYRVYRQADGAPERTVLQTELIVNLSYRDEKAKTGNRYTYIVAAVDTHGNEGPAAQSTVEVQ